MYALLRVKAPRFVCLLVIPNYSSVGATGFDIATIEMSKYLCIRSHQIMHDIFE